MASRRTAVLLAMIAACAAIAAVDAASVSRSGLQIGFTGKSDVVRDGAVQSGWTATKPTELAANVQSITFAVTNSDDSALSVNWHLQNAGAVMVSTLHGAASNRTTTVRPNDEPVLITVSFTCVQSMTASNMLTVEFASGSYDNITLVWQKVCNWPEVFISLIPKFVNPYLVKASHPVASFDVPFNSSTVLYAWTSAADADITATPIRDVSVRTVDPDAYKQLSVSYGFTRTGKDGRAVLVPGVESKEESFLGIWIAYSCLSETTEMVKLVFALDIGWVQTIDVPFTKQCKRKASPKLSIGYRTDSDVVSDGYVRSDWNNLLKPYDLSGINFFSLKFSYPASAAASLSQRFSVATHTVSSFGATLPVPPTAADAVAYRVTIPSLDQSADSEEATPSQPPPPRRSNTRDSDDDAPTNSNPSTPRPLPRPPSVRRDHNATNETDADTSLAVETERPFEDPESLMFRSNVELDPTSGVYSGLVGVTSLLVAAEQATVTVDFVLHCQLDEHRATTRIDITLHDKPSAAGEAEYDSISLYFTKVCHFPLLEIGTSDDAEDGDVVHNSEGLKSAGLPAFVASDSVDSTQFFVWLRATDQHRDTQFPVQYSIRATGSGGLTVHSSAATTARSVAALPTDSSTRSSFKLSYTCPEPDTLDDGAGNLRVSIEIDIGWAEKLSIPILKSCPTPGTESSSRSHSRSASDDGSDSGRSGSVSGSKPWGAGATTLAVLISIGCVVWVGGCFYNYSIDHRRGLDIVPGAETAVRCYEDLSSGRFECCWNRRRGGGGGDYHSVSQNSSSANARSSASSNLVGNNHGVTPQMDPFDEELDRAQANGGVFGSGVPNAAGSDYQSDL